MLTLAQNLGRPPLQRLVVIFGRIHISQDQSAWIDAAPIARIDKIQTKLLDRVRSFSRTPIQCGGNPRGTFAPVNSGEWLDAALGSWNHGFARGMQRARKQPFEPFSRKVRQVTGNNQIPRRVCCTQGRRDSCQRTTPSLFRATLSTHLIRDDVQSERSITVRRSDNRDLGNKWIEQSGRTKDQWDAAKIKQSLVTAHARTGAPRKNEAGELKMAFHDRIRFYDCAQNFHSPPEDCDVHNWI